VGWCIFQVLGGSLGNWSAFENPKSQFNSHGCKVTNYFSVGLLWWSVIQQLGLIPRTDIQLKSIKVQSKFGDGGLLRLGGTSALDCHHSMANTVTLINHGPFRAVSASGPAPAPTTQKAEALIGSLNASLLWPDHIIRSSDWYCNFDLGSRFLWFSHHALLYIHIQPNGKSFARAAHVDWRGHLSSTYHICVWTLNLLNVCHSYVHSLQVQVTILNLIK
jgi:hypothetical protein